MHVRKLTLFMHSHLHATTNSPCNHQFTMQPLIHHVITNSPCNHHSRPSSFQHLRVWFCFPTILTTSSLTESSPSQKSLIFFDFHIFKKFHLKLTAIKKYTLNNNSNNTDNNIHNIRSNNPQSNEEQAIAEKAGAIFIGGQELIKKVT